MQLLQTASTIPWHAKLQCVLFWVRILSSGAYDASVLKKITDLEEWPDRGRLKRRGEMREEWWLIWEVAQLHSKLRQEDGGGWPEKKQNARNVEVVLFSLLLYYVNVCWWYIGPILILVPSGMVHLNHWIEYRCNTYASYTEHMHIQWCMGLHAWAYISIRKSGILFHHHFFQHFQVRDLYKRFVSNIVSDDIQEQHIL